MSTAARLLLAFGAVAGSSSLCILVAFGLNQRALVWLIVAGQLLIVALIAGITAKWLAKRQRDEREDVRATAMAEAQREVDDYFENAAVGLHWVGHDGRILRANRAELKLLGYDAAEYIGQPVARFHVSPETATDILKRLAAGEVLRNCATQLRAKDGSIKEVLIDSDVYWRDGQFVHTRCFMRDVTDIKRAEEDVRESEERFRSLADKAPVLIWMSDRTMRYDFFNQFWLDFTGRPLEQELGDGWMEGVHPDDRERCQETYAAAFRARQGFTMEFRLRRADGEYRWVLNTGVPRFTKNGFFFGYIGSCIDITDRKQWEQDQQRALHALEEMDRRKDEFLAVLSHELRNPLGPILNALHILRGGQLKSPDLIDARDVIERQIQQLAGIVDDLLDVFRITHRKIVLRKEALNLAELVRTTAEDHRRALEQSGLRVNAHVPDEPIWVLADRTRVSQVMSNLFNNTLKFTNDGDQVAVSVHKDAEQRRAVVTIRDTGIGVAPEMVPHVFETFTQADRSFDRSRGGLGLGLALVKGLVELHGGAVSLRSPGVGKGTEISFWLPLGAPPVEAPTAPPLVTARSLRILIVEDNRDTARTLGTLLTRYGHSVTVTHNGLEGVEAARREPPDVVLCDLGLPKMDGYQVAQTLRGDAALASTRLIAVSGYGQEEDRQRSEAAGFDLHLTKPVDPVDLQRLLAILKVGR